VYVYVELETIFKFHQLVVFLFITIQMSESKLLLTIAVAIFVGSALQTFFKAIITDLVSPFLVVIMPDTKQTSEGLILELGPIKLRIGDAIGATVTLAIALVVVAVTLPYIRAYSPIKGGSR
jgi:hypothetical protein